MRLSSYELSDIKQILAMTQDEVDRRATEAARGNPDSVYPIKAGLLIAHLGNAQRILQRLLVTDRHESLFDRIEGSERDYWRAKADAIMDDNHEWDEDERTYRCTSDGDELKEHVESEVEEVDWDALMEAAEERYNAHHSQFETLGKLAV